MKKHLSQLSFKKGESLVETLVYIAILVFLVVVIVSLLFNLIGSQKTIKASKSIENSASYALERIIREIRYAESVNTGSSILDTNPGKLVLNSFDANGNTKTVEFYIATSSIKMKENGVDKGFLTQSDTQVTNLIFTSVSGTNSSAVRTQMTLQSGTSTSFRTANFYSTVILRSSL